MWHVKKMYLQRVVNTNPSNQAHEKGVAHIAFCLQHSMALSAGIFASTVETTPDVLVWRVDRSRGLLTQDVQMRLKGHDGQVLLSLRAWQLSK